MSFATPSAPSGGIDFKDHLGSLLLFTVHGVEEGINTVHGTASAAKVDVAVIDGPGAGETHLDTLVFPKVLTSQLRKNIGEKVLGRLGQGTAKPGQSAPWILNAPADGDIAKAEAWVATNNKSTVASAAPPF